MSPPWSTPATKPLLRLTFSNRTPALIREGMARLGRVVRAHACARG